MALYNLFWFLNDSPFRLQCIIIIKSDEIVTGAGNFGPKSSFSIHYTIKITPI